MKTIKSKFNKLMADDFYGDIIFWGCATILFFLGLAITGYLMFTFFELAIYGTKH